MRLCILALLSFLLPATAFLLPPPVRLSPHAPRLSSPHRLLSSPSTPPPPSPPSTNFLQLTTTQFSLLSSLLPSSPSISLLLPSENPLTGALEFSPLIVHSPLPGPLNLRSAAAPQLSGYHQPKQVLPLYPFVSDAPSSPLSPDFKVWEVDGEDVGDIGNLVYNEREGELTVRLLHDSRTTGLIVISSPPPLIPPPGAAFGPYSPMDLRTVARLTRATSLSLRLASTADAYALQSAAATAALHRLSGSLSDDLHALKNPASVIRVLTKLLQRRISAGATRAEVQDLLVPLENAAEELQGQMRGVSVKVGPLLPASEAAIDVDGAREELAPPASTNRTMELNLAGDLLLPIVTAASAVCDAANVTLLHEGLAEGGAELPGVRVNRGGLSRVVTEVLFNAIKYTSVEADERWIKVVVGESGAEEGGGAVGIAVTVTSHSRAMEEGERARAAERGYRGGNVPSGVDGDGLGLDIARREMRAMGGELEVVACGKGDRVREGRGFAIRITCLR